MEERIIQIIEELTGVKDINKNSDLLEEEVLDSLAFIELIETLENEYDVEIQPTQVPPYTWKNVNNIVNLIKKIQ